MERWFEEEVSEEAAAPQDELEAVDSEADDLGDARSSAIQSVGTGTGT
jgi:hypothetical protein